jgi:hypothetical protein
MLKKLLVFITILSILFTVFSMAASAAPKIEEPQDKEVIVNSSGSYGIQFYGGVDYVSWTVVGGLFSGTITVNGIPTYYNMAAAGVSYLGYFGSYVTYSGTIGTTAVSGGGIVTHQWTFL